jgi:hypothetical protein
MPNTAPVEGIIPYSARIPGFPFLLSVWPVKPIDIASSYFIHLKFAASEHRNPSV